MAVEPLQVESRVPEMEPRAPQYAGLRMTADEYLELSDDGFRYELIDGVVVMSPSPTPPHQDAALEIAFQIKSYLRARKLGRVYVETDVHVTAGLVYRPELIFVRAERVAPNRRRIVEPPDVVVEVVSPESRRYDLETKRGDYERFGVREYWIIDPQRDAYTFLRLTDGRFVDVAATPARYESAVIPGFILDLDAVRDAYRGD